jgi:GntR family transcriptional repressor for pyruvate dehydrogenase complex
VVADLKIYHPLGSQKSLAEQVTDEIERLMLIGRLKEGEKLPSERELGELFGVSRTVVREAIRSLRTKGLLEVRPGIGSIVRGPSSNQVIEGLSLLIRAKANDAEVSLAALCEVRALLGVEIAKMAAERATAEDTEEIQRVINELETLVNLPPKFYEKSLHFHRSLALATHNPLLVVIFDAIQDLVLSMRQALVPEPIDPKEGLRAHQEIFEHIRDGNPGGAAEAMRQHLREIWHKFEAALARHEGEGSGAEILREAQIRS